MYTTQTLFNTVAAHLLTQGVKAAVMDEDGDELFRYRGPNGTKCAVGCLIPNELYRPEMEGRNIGSLIYDNEYGLRTLFDKVDLRILPELQIVHDMHDPRNWVEELAKIAIAYSLDADVLGQFCQF